MGHSVINQDDILKEYEITLEDYDIQTIELDNDPDLKRITEIMKEIEKGV